MKIYILLSILILGSSLAQNFDFVRSHPVDGLNAPRLSSSIDLDSQDRPVVGRMVSNKLNYTHPYGDFVIEKLDLSGTQLWSDTLSGNVNLKGLLVDRHDDIYAFGNYRDSIAITGSDFPLHNESETHSWIAKLDGEGQLIWMGSYNPNISEIKDISSICEGQNGIWVAAHAGFGVSKIFQMEPGGALNMVVEQEHVGSAMSMSVDPSGGLWVTGATSMGPQSFNGYSAEAPYSYNQYIARYNRSGEAQWVNFIEDVTAENQQIVTDQEGYAYFGTGLRGDFMFGDIQTQGPDWVYDFAITRLDSNGNFLWLREVPLDTLLGDGGEGFGAFLDVGVDNSIYFSGFIRHSIDWGNGVFTEANAYNDILLLNFDSDGEARWGKTAGGEHQDSGDALAVDSQGNLWVTGRCGESASFDSITVTGTFTNAYIARVTMNPTTINDSESELLPQMTLEANYPNPFNPTTRINYTLDQGSTVDLRVFDVTGREVSALTNTYQSPGSYSHIFSAANIPAGVYIYRLTTEMGAQSRKMLVLK